MIIQHPSLSLLTESIQKLDILKIFDFLLIIATDVWASDIHIEPYEAVSRIRIRIDGVMQNLTEFPRSIHENIIAKFKIESGQMRPDEKRLPQDARVSTITSTKKELDLRANTTPTVWGEKLVLRIVDKSQQMPSLDQLGIEWINKKIFQRNISFPNGIIVITWPTGSWKTTTLYAALSQLNKPWVNIMTYEDPVEAKIFGLNQSQIRPDINYSFAQGLRASLRQDPDIVMVGEIRDWETLDTAMEASMTGHLVFSTLHTNSASETLTRVMNLGAQPYMLTGTFNLIVAQRLARKISAEHRSEINVKQQTPELYSNALHALSTMSKELLQQELALRWIDIANYNKFVTEWLLLSCDIQAWDAVYKWRVGLYEMLEFDDEIKQMLLQNQKSLEIEHYALEHKGMINIERDGIFKALQGKTSLSEVYRLVRPKKQK
jgi:type IV pilus assembly protein PilB